MPNTTAKPTKYSRREMLKMSALAGAGIAVGASGLGTITAIADKLFVSPAENDDKKQTVPFYGAHQAGIITPQQSYSYTASFNLLTDDRQQVIKLFKKWTEIAAAMTVGQEIGSGFSNDWLPPKDTGEAEDLSTANLTITYGLGSTFFRKDGKDRFGVASRKPKYLRDIPKMPGEALDEAYTGGDICIQVCADIQQTAFHAIRNFIKNAIGTAEVKWIQGGFLSAPTGKTGRNLFGFKDGTANRSVKDKSGHQKIIWADSSEPSWMIGGTYMAIRKIKMFLEVWDRSSLKDQEDTFGRKKDSGAAYGNVKEHQEVNAEKLPANSHVRLAKSMKQEIFRRGYSYTDGIDQKTGSINAGLFFISFQQNPDKQFIPMLKLMSQKDKLNEYTKHIGSALFACPGGIKKGQYMAQGILEGSIF
ncbi:iron uptake transporter deferrochelatase/peroxidase subunit [Falsibacillus pallidus]|uniref:Deferrochelatase n=1 Tax=Falsibacillus pallidus TaxID=493781 RepID=A0A370GQC0_9BACI|nr:iron uptake transporter deferrochelatase/peroxidase subunit [Falsibacillus pallidus]RDI45918.1 deferrochelatase/peroxidase EfeB [Falsibacillus pallidus]